MKRRYAYVIPRKPSAELILCAPCHSEFEYPRGLGKRAIKTIKRLFGTECCDNCCGNLATGRGAMP